MINKTPDESTVLDAIPKTSQDIIFGL